MVAHRITPLVAHLPTSAQGREIPGIGRLSSDGVLHLSPACATACGHHLMEGATIDRDAASTREWVRGIAQAAADELGVTVRVTTTWDGRSTWTVQACDPSAAQATSGSSESARGTAR